MRGSGTGIKATVGKGLEDFINEHGLGFNLVPKGSVGRTFSRKMIFYKWHFNPLC